jgi:hypothetical protein
MNTLTKGNAKAGKMTVGDFVNMSVSFTVGTEATNAINIAMQFKDGLNKNLTGIKHVKWWLASNAAGTTIASAPASGIAIGTNGTLIESINNVYGTLITNATGAADVTITDAGTPTFYLVIGLPNGSISVSSAITFA